jgi:hypothetical protein
MGRSTLVEAMTLKDRMACNGSEDLNYFKKIYIPIGYHENCFLGAQIFIMLSIKHLAMGAFIGLANRGKDIVFRFILEYSSLMDFGPWVLIIIIIIGLF